MWIWSPHSSPITASIPSYPIHENSTLQDGPRTGMAVPKRG